MIGGAGVPSVEVRIGARVIGPGRPTFVVAEAGVNHNGSVELAKALVAAAADAAADAVKFQTFKAERLASARAPKATYQLETTGRQESQREMLRRLELPQDAYRELQLECQKRDLVFLSSPFDTESADLLDEIGVSAFKLGSGEITNRPLLEHVAGKGKPIILSTGMAYLAEVRDAVRTVRAAGCRELIVLHCVSAYPADPGDANLAAIPALAAALDVPVGFSDHTEGNDVALAAVALGACLLEKHFTLDRTLPGPDHRASLEPGELKALVASIRTVERARGDGVKRPVAAELENREIVRRSLAVAIDLAAGTVLEPRMLAPLRPATGISPLEIDGVLGRRTRRALQRGELLAWSDLE